MAGYSKVRRLNIFLISFHFLGGIRFALGRLWLLYDIVLVRFEFLGFFRSFLVATLCSTGA